jgi:hypothetical protein
VSSKTQISNLALSNIGIGTQIANLDSERSTEANVCRVFYEVTRKTVLRDFNWPFATKFEDLGLVEEDPTTEWDYSYRYPSDSLKVRRVLSGVRNDTRQSRVPYKFGNDSSGQLIYTDEQDAVAEITLDLTNPERYPDDFVLAMSFRLSVYIIPQLSRGDPFGMRKSCMAEYLALISKAATNAANEEQLDEEPLSEFIRSREE